MCWGLGFRVPFRALGLRLRGCRPEKPAPEAQDPNPQNANHPEALGHNSKTLKRRDSVNLRGPAKKNRDTYVLKNPVEETRYLFAQVS